MTQRKLSTYQGWKSQYLRTKRAKPSVPFNKTPFGKLPTELRDEIYRYYYEVPGGYVVNPSTNKLRTAAGNPIDLSLGSVCLDLRAQTHGLAFEMNAVHATTTSPESEFRTSAERWSQAVRLNHLLDCATLFATRSVIADNILDDILGNFPEYDRVLGYSKYCDMWRYASGSMMSATEGPSTERKFLRYALDLLQQQPGFAAKVPRHLFKLRIKAKLDGPSSLDFWRMTNEPGTIINPIELPLLGSTLLPAGYTSHSYSAAAVMIIFLARYIQHPVFMQIRDVHLHEDRPSAAFPECHAEPFVDFLTINSNLKVHRNVSLWRNIWASVCKERSNGVGRVDEILSQTIYRWMVEAEQVMASVGRDRGVFRLQFDCDAMPDFAKEIFDMMQENAAWQYACGESLRKALLLGDPVHDDRFLWDPHGLLDGKLLRMNKPTSLFSCNFSYGIDVKLRDSILEKDWSDPEWWQSYQRRFKCCNDWAETWRAQTAGMSFRDPIILD